ncbi:MULTISPECIES: hypothetical protein [Ensifer]|jgi:hypothetical protein|uniref:Uncharacterized protein n=1 Tax=Ensifer canadensis TaxID=555315 RepID=A0AAW4FWR3_9HYPH|nr:MULTISPECIES: hypothetical protein [Ensifer]MBM3095847.1 hypothetical protein [Ensifer canadensis]UBI80048.1 hypothetical protein J3R84_31050 [Ensifer canadensis]
MNRSAIIFIVLLCVLVGAVLSLMALKEDFWIRDSSDTPNNPLKQLIAQ